MGCAAILSLAACGIGSTDFDGAVPGKLERIWVGPDYYGNRLQDWRIRDGRIEIESVEGSAAKPMRTLHLLTRSLGEEDGPFRMEARTGPVQEGPRRPWWWPTEGS